MAFNMFKKKCKQDYVISVDKICDFTGSSKEVILRWRRGKKESNKGKFNPIQITDSKTDVTGATISLHCTLFEKAKAGYYEEKLVQFILENINGKKICSGVIDLAQFADLDGKTENVICEMRAKGKTLKAKLLISITSTQGVSTGNSENTECFVLDSEEEYSTNQGPDPIHASLIQQMKAREEKEEEELRQKQMKERDESVKNEEPEFLDELPPKETTLPKTEEKDEIIEGIETAQIQPIQNEEQEIVKEEKPKEIEEVKKVFEETVSNEQMIEMLNKYTEEDSRKFIISKYVESVGKDITPLIDSCIFSNRSVFENNTNDIEQVNAFKIMEMIKHIYDVIEEKGIEEEVISLTIKQLYHFLAYYVLDTLFTQPEKICCSKGFQIKYVMSYMDMYSSDKHFQTIKDQYSQMNVVTDIANVFILHHVIAVNDLETTFPSLSVNIIYQLLSNFHTDEMDPEPVSQTYLRSIQDKCTNDPIPTRFSVVA
ncbi:hypothetical protein EHI8A_156710 [Entamoeba histolytica HM-1:IMSS-B]|nr:hypothetical protein EHI8A_156710 [Entamoeba histolytica HM-1:IMSS-B]GAT92426.1 hypothetical protein CL6EHI_179020 [Entamoeba histolytica]